MRIFITGANGGLGYELVKRAIRRGHFVYAGAYMPDGIDELNKQIQLCPDKLKIFDLDVTSDESVAKVAEEIERTAGRLDAIVNAAGVLFDKNKQIDELDISEMKTTFEVNTFGPYRVIKAMLPLLYKGRNQVIVNISSEAASISNVGTTYCSYSMSKVALTMMNQMFANLLTDKGIRVYAVHPGRMNTKMGRETAQMEPKESAKHILGLITGRIEPQIRNGVWFINYKGEPMDL